MGADSCAATGLSWQVVENPKLFAAENRFLIGCCGDFRLIDLLAYALKIPPQPAKITADSYMRTIFIDAVRKCLKHGGYLAKDADDREQGGQFLVGYQGALYEVQDDNSVLTLPAWGHACGSGAEAARGSLWTTRDDRDCKKRISTALEAAEATTTNVRHPFRIMEI